MTKIKVSNQATIVAVRGLVAIRAEDGSRIVITPALARDLVKHLPQFADLAEGLSDPNPMNAIPTLYNRPSLIQ